MATGNLQIQVENTTGATNFKIKYRLMGDSMWTIFTIPAAEITGTTIPNLLPNRIYQAQVQNLNEADNPLSLISQAIGFTDPNPVISPTADQVGYTFSNLSEDINSYLAQLTTADDPATIIGSHSLPSGTYPNTITDAFTDLQPITSYRLVIAPVAGTATQPFVHMFSTSASNQCPDPVSITATIIYK